MHAINYCVLHVSSTELNKRQHYTLEIYTVAIYSFRILMALGLFSLVTGFYTRNSPPITGAPWWPTRWKFCSRFIDSRLNAQYLFSYRLDIGSRILAFGWYQNRWPWMTLNCEMVLFCVILPNLVVSGAHCLKVVNEAITMDNLRLLSSSKRLQRDHVTHTGINIL